MTLSYLFEGAKNLCGYVISTAAERYYRPPTVFISKATSQFETFSESLVKTQFELLSDPEKGQVYGKIYELAKMENPSIEGDRWGELHAFDDTSRLATAMHRTGLFNALKEQLAPVRCLPFGFGEGGIGSQYYTLADRLQRNPIPGRVSYVNGMGIPTLELALSEARKVSDRFVDGNNIHGVYNATHQTAPKGDRCGFFRDILRFKAVDGGSYTKTPLLIAQQWIDYLNAHPGRNFLQIAQCEGAAHVNAALRLVQRSCPELLRRIRVLTLCPAHFILPETYPGVQIINLVKREDTTVIPWGVGSYQVGISKHIIIVPHTEKNPHNHQSEDFVKVGKVYVREFLRSGNLYSESISILIVN